MLGIEFIGPGRRESDDARAAEIGAVAGLPPAYRSTNALSDHLSRAVFYDALYLSSRQHWNVATVEPFRCAAYYAEDQIDPAICSRERFGHLATMSIAFVRRLIGVSERLGAALAHRPRAGARGEAETTRSTLPRDPDLGALLRGDAQVGEAEALEIVAGWPAGPGAERELGSYTLFYDMIRLIWLHEWAHALCGHVALAETELGVERLHEFSADRADGGGGNDAAPRRNEVFQGLEIHADEFAVRHCIGHLLWGYDPMAEMAGRRIDLMDRLLIFNVACCCFTVMWALAERRYSPDDTFYAPPGSGERFVVTRSTHPPAVLRYDRFRGFQRDLTHQYGVRQGHPELATYVDAFSFGFLKPLRELSPYFAPLDAVTPMIARTPTTKALIDYGDHLVRRGEPLAAKLESLCYLPTADPGAAMDD